MIVNPFKSMSEYFLWKITDVKIIDGIVNGTAKVVLATGSSLKYIQSGIIQNYALIMVVGIVFIIAIFFIN